MEKRSGIVYISYRLSNSREDWRDRLKFLERIKLRIPTKPKNRCHGGSVVAGHPRTVKSFKTRRCLNFLSAFKMTEGDDGPNRLADPHHYRAPYVATRIDALLLALQHQRSAKGRKSYRCLSAETHWGERRRIFDDATKSALVMYIRIAFSRQHRLITSEDFRVLAKYCEVLLTTHCDSSVRAFSSIDL